MTDTRCIWTATETPRALTGHHLHDCESTECRGCEPCTEGHCIVCGRNHVDRQTCTECISATRADLDEIAWLCRHLRYQAGHSSRDGEPHRDRVLGGDALVMMVGANYGRDGTDYGQSSDPMPPLSILASWEDDWRNIFGHEPAGRATMRAARRYLTQQLHHAAQAHPAYDEFVTDLRRCRSALENVVHDGEREERGAPCPLCGKGALVKSYGEDEAADRWRCRNSECRQWWTDADYRAKVGAAYELNAEALTASAIARVYRVAEGTVRQWGNREHVKKRGKDGNGRQLYDVADVLAWRDRNADREVV